MAVDSLLVFALREAIAHNRDLQTKWTQAYTRLVAVSGEVGLLCYQPDYRIDLVLRAMEDEVAPRLRAAPEGEDQVNSADDLQHTLTRYWVLSTHDALCIAKNSPAGEANAELQSLYERFRLVRVPIAKLQIAADNKLKGGTMMLVPIGEGAEAEPEAYAKGAYHPPTLIDPESGSIGWMPINVAAQSTDTIYRRRLSDELLFLFDQP